MEKSNLEKKLKIQIPNINQVIENIAIEYINPVNNMLEKTSLEKMFRFDHFPLEDFGDNLTNDFEYYSVPLFMELKILPFAEDGGGYFFCLNYNETPTNPKVVLWIRDNEYGKNLASIADSFDEFISMLKSEEEIDALESR